MSLLAGPVAANPLKSLYTTIELKDCRQVRQHPDGSTWLCPGLEDYPVLIGEGDNRTFVAVGPEAEKRRAAKQTLPAFNSLFRKAQSRATIEWRIVRREGRALPFATIQRYFTSDGSRSGEVLVVTKVTAQEECHVAYIDALANPQAIVLARTVADRDARSFDCKAEPQRVGRGGRSPL
ncbi:MAG: hypothetical protein JSS20_06845 [Proteobacteria bacterium]|nr:hypothetical protein [Pseudomonadota bacterium]